MNYMSLLVSWDVRQKVSLRVTCVGGNIHALMSVATARFNMFFLFLKQGFRLNLLYITPHVYYSQIGWVPVLATYAPSHSHSVSSISIYFTSFQFHRVACLSFVAHSVVLCMYAKASLYTCGGVDMKPTQSRTPDVFMRDGEGNTSSERFLKLTLILISF